MKTLPDTQAHIYRQEQVLKGELHNALEREQRYVHLHYALFFIVGFLVGVLANKGF